nr:integrase, catalytic region, zinc finger, CCHC-type, peptidase aspartic, catalytic [Tanacetum cinerariifolium]
LNQKIKVKMIDMWLKKSVTKWRIQRLCDLFDENNLFIFDDESVRISPVSKMPFRKKPCDSMNHMTGNHALLTNFVEKFLEMVRFGNNDFAMIAGYGDVVIGSMTIKKVYYVEGLGHNLLSVGQFCDKGLPTWHFKGGSGSGYRLFPLIQWFVVGRGWEKTCTAFGQEKGVGCTVV